jgi:hypothetical protein
VRGFVPPDPETQVSTWQYAMVSVPRRNRKRFSRACVTIKASREQALLAADPQNKYYPAIVLGPSKSSEGQYIYYLDEWLYDDLHGG